MSSLKDLLYLTPQQFVEYLKKENISRFYFVYDPARKLVTASHPQLQQIAEFIQNDERDFMQHEGMFFQISRKYDTLQGAFIHRTNRGQAAGGVRYWHYPTMEAYLRDGMRLAVGMAYKNALAGLWWGGGKGVMAHNPAIDLHDPAIRASLYREYGELMTSIRGCYVTAEDVGTNVADMANIFTKTRFTTCIPPELGGSGNPSVPTARGVVSGMEAALEFCGLDGLEGKTIATQGMGNVGAPLIRYLFEKKVKKIIACDIYPELKTTLDKEFAGKNFESFIVAEDNISIFEKECDILSPNATGAILNPRTIPLIKAKIVCGAANNQLEESARDDKALFERGIIYVPDFLTNRMGIVNCADEQAGYVNNDPHFERHLEKEWEFSIYQMALKVFRESQTTKESPAKVAVRMADKLSRENHPIFGHRGQQIIHSLVEDLWHER